MIGFGYSLSLPPDSGLKYFLTDQQGSAVAALGANGQIVTGSEQRYLPFGKVRSIMGSSPITQTDFGYTGQRNLSNLGLMDYKARFYDPTIGRFIQPDTIVSNPANPQTWNRFSYVSNNPINRIDPSGHRDCSAIPVGTARDACTGQHTDPGPDTSVEQLLKNSGVTLDGTWDSKHKFAVYMAVMLVGTKFAQRRGKGETAAQAFQAVYNGVQFTWGSGYTSGGCADAAYTGGGCTSGPHQINFKQFMSGEIDSNPYTRMEKNVVHELGHAFDYSQSTVSNNMPDTVFYGGVRDDALRPNMADNGEYSPKHYDWQQHPPAMDAQGSTRGETFADMFVAWTYDAWNTRTDGQNIIARLRVENWMDKQVPAP